MDQENALIVSQETLSEYFGISKRTIIRQLNVLKEKGFIEIIKSGTANVYLVNANIAWTSYANKKSMRSSKLMFLFQNPNKNIKSNQVNLNNLIC